MWLSILYLLLGLLSTFLWSRGFAAYLCLGDSCQYLLSLLNRPLILWQMLFYSLAATGIMAGWLKKKPKITFTYLTLGLVARLVLLVLAWRGTEYLSGVWLAFLAAEILLLLIAWQKRPGGSKGRVAVIIMVVLTVIALVLIVVKPNISTNTVLRPYNSEAEEAPGELFTDGIMTVTDVKGNIIKLDLRERPIFFWAWWCPYCTDDMENLKRLPNEEKPYMVITAIKDLEDDIEKSREKLANIGIEDATIYVYEKERMVLIPTLFFWDQATETVRMH